MEVGNEGKWTWLFVQRKVKVFSLGLNSHCRGSLFCHRSAENDVEYELLAYLTTESLGIYAVARSLLQPWISFLAKDRSSDLEVRNMCSWIISPLYFHGAECFSLQDRVWTLDNMVKLFLFLSCVLQTVVSDNLVIITMSKIYWGFIILYRMLDTVSSRLFNGSFHWSYTIIIWSRSYCHSHFALTKLV